jgi:radical SAM protein with 4Fe4S-binding SPASM domain
LDALYIPKSPITLCIGLTTKCNLNCRHCSADANSENVFFPHSELITIIDTAKELGVKKLIFGGGEPLLYEQLFDVCEYALAQGFKVSFVTNGTLVSEMMDRFSRILDYRHSFEVGVSLDGHTPEIHGYFRPAETFDPAVEAINLLKNEGFNVSVSCVLSKGNIETIPDFLKFLLSLNQYDIRFLPFTLLGRGKDCAEEMFSSAELYGLIKEQQEWREVFGNNISINFPWEFLSLPVEKRQPSPCETGYLRLWINCSGDIFPCPHMETVVIGNIFRNSISDVWNKSPILKALRNPALLKGTCASCQYRDGCRGGCRGLAYLMEGDYLCSDPYCPIVVQNKNLQA